MYDCGGANGFALCERGCDVPNMFEQLLIVHAKANFDW